MQHTYMLDVDSRAAAGAVRTSRREPLLASDPVFSWIEAVEQYEEVLASGDSDAVVQGFALVASKMADCAGAVLHVALHGRCIAVAVHGLPRDLPGLLGMPIDATSLAALASLSIADLHACPELDGTFAREALVSRGFRSAQTISLGGRTGQIARLTLFCGEPGFLATTTERAIRLVARRMFATLDYSSVVQSAHADSAQLRGVMDSASDAIVGTDAAGVIRLANPAVSRLFGAPESSFIGSPIDTVIDPADRVLLQQLLGDRHSELAVQRRATAHQVAGLRRDGAPLALDITVSALEGGLGFTVILRDVTQRKNAEARLRENDRLAVIGTLAAGLGHDLNNVLFPIRAHTNAIASIAAKQGVEACEPHLSAVRASVAYLQHLADSLHSLALDPEGDGDGIVSTDLRAWWTQSGPLLQKALHRSADLDVCIASALPSVAVPPHALTRAVLNLLVNAAEAMPEGRARELSRVMLRADLDLARDEVVLEVIDNGIGMSEEVQRRATDMFFTTKTRGLGTGLGLPLVRRVVERAGGSLELRSRVGAGTTIRMRLPIVRDAPAEQPSVVAVQVEDGRLADIVRGFLEAHGAVIDGELALDDVDVLVVDADRVAVCGARRWITVHAPEQLVVLGKLPRAEREGLQEIGATLVQDIHDIAAIERALDAAMEHSKQEKRSE